MEDLTFGEQVKIILGRKGMTIKELAETIERRTGMKMSRQNLTQRLGRDNFQEQDMRMIAGILGCKFQLSIMNAEVETEVSAQEEAQRLEAEAKAQEEAQRLEAEAKAQEEAQRLEAEAKAQEEAQRLEAEVKAQEEAQRLEAEAKAREEAQRLEEEAKAREEAQRLEAEAKAQEEAQRLEAEAKAQEEEMASTEREMTIGEWYDIHEELSELEENARAGESVEAIKEELEKPKRFRPGNFFMRRKNTAEEKPAAVPVAPISKEEPKQEPVVPSQEEERPEPVIRRQEEERPAPVVSSQGEEDRVVGEINPYTGQEYQTDSVRMHPKRIGYVQVYDRSIHKWTDMTEWAFLGYQERKKALLGSAYEPPTYLD